MNNGWTGEECLGLLGSQMSNKSLETINVCGPKRQHWHITQGQKFTVVAPGAKLLQLRQRKRQSCRVSTDPITIWIMGFSFLFWQGLSISHSCACSPTDAPSVTITELLSASSSSPFQANKFIHLVLCYSVQHRWTGDPCEGFSPRTQPGDTLEGKAEAGSELDLLLFFSATVGWRCNIWSICQDREVLSFSNFVFFPSSIILRLNVAGKMIHFKSLDKFI